MLGFSVRIAPFGKYRKLIRDMEGIAKIFDGEIGIAQRELAEAAKKFMVDGIKNQREGWAELSEITKAFKGHDKLLIDSGSFIESISTWPEGKRWYAGIPEGAKGSKGQDLNLVGSVHEEGASIPVSDEMRRFFAAKGFPLRADTQFVTIPPRPWFEPAQRELDEYADVVLAEKLAEILEMIG